MFLYFLIAVMVLSWSANFIIAKVTLRELPPFALLFLRVLFSNGLLLALYFSSLRLRSGQARQHQRRPLQAGDWRWFALLGFCGIALNQTGFTVGIHYTTVSHSSLIITLAPIFVLILATRMKLERFTPLKLVGMALSFAGVAVLSLEHGAGSNSPTFLGDLLTLGGSLGFALYTVYGKSVSERYDTLTFNTYTYLVGLVAVTPVAGWELFEVNWHAVTWRGWLGVAYMAGIASVVAYMIYYYALTKISATRVIAFSYLQPLLATVLGIAILGEAVSHHLVIGGAMVLTGVFLAERGRG